MNAKPPQMFFSETLLPLYLHLAVRATLLPQNQNGRRCHLRRQEVAQRRSVFLLAACPRPSLIANTPNRSSKGIQEPRQFHVSRLGELRLTLRPPEQPGHHAGGARPGAGRKPVNGVSAKPPSGPIMLGRELSISPNHTRSDLNSRNFLCSLQVGFSPSTSRPVVSAV
jgi:hypothetical protein